MKKLILFISLFVCAATAKAQYNYSEWGFGGGYSIVRPYSDLAQNNKDKSFNVDLYYNYSPYLPFALEVQKGRLSGGNDLTDPSHRYFTNNFLSISVHADLQLGEIIDYDNNFFLQLCKGLYLGTGVGGSFNNVAVRRYAVDDPTYRFPGKDRSLNLLVPIRFGYEVKIYNYDDEPFMSISVGYVHNLTFSEGMDGYDDPSNHFKNNAQDMFSQITVGLKFNIGEPVSYIKSIK